MLKTLKGKTGKTGSTGKEGPAGKEGPTGKEGPAGKNGVGTPLFFRASANTGPTVIATLDGAQIIAECNAKTETILTLHRTSDHGVYHGSYDVEGKGTEVWKDDLKAKEDLKMQGTTGEDDDEGWFSYIGPTGGITTGVSGEDRGGSHSQECLGWGNLESSSTASTGGALLAGRRRC